MEDADTTTWPDGQCQCPNGACLDEIGWPSEHDPALLAEVQKVSPNLATVRFLLDQGARVNLTNSARLPILIIAARMRHAEVVSVLITAGADPNTDDYSYYNVPFNAAVGRNGYSAREDAELLVHFGDAAAIAGVSVSWKARDLNALSGRCNRHVFNNDEARSAVGVMAAYLADGAPGQSAAPTTTSAPATPGAPEKRILARNAPDFPCARRTAGPAFPNAGCLKRRTRQPGRTVNANARAAR